MDTYASLQTTIADWLNRDDLIAAVPSFIRLAEADMARKVRHWRMEKRSVAQIGTRFLTLPPDWLETIRLEMVGGARLDLSTSAAIADTRGEFTGQANPRLYAHTGGAIEIWPTPASAVEVELLYYAQLPRISDAAPTSWLLDEAPDAYLYGALIASAPYLKDDARIAVWAGLYQAAIDATNANSERAVQSGTGLRVKLKGWA